MKCVALFRQCVDRDLVTHLIFQDGVAARDKGDVLASFVFVDGWDRD